MKRYPIIAGFLSIVVPGLGQIYRGESLKGGLILAAAIIIGNLNIIILPLISMANPLIPPAAFEVRSIWAYWIPKTVHGIVSFWSIAFYLWAVIDAFVSTTSSKDNPLGFKLLNKEE